MAITHKSQTEKQNKDYWRTPFNLVDDALNLLGIDAFDIDVCCKDESIKIPYTYWCIRESQDALSDDIQWFSQLNMSRHCTTSFCNPPFSKKWEFFKKAIEQSKKWGKSVLMVLPYTPATKQWHQHVHGQDCIIYVPDGRYQYLLPDGTKPVNSCNFETCLILIVPFKCGNVIVNYERGLNV